MRGWSCFSFLFVSNSKVFPAHAGVILDKSGLNCNSKCISRTCGGDPERRKERRTRRKYFPHMRGWSQVTQWKLSYLIVFPAHAGVILLVSYSLYHVNSISRTCGGDPIQWLSNGHHLRYFPHMRGWSFSEPMQKLPRKVFPAHAGVILIFFSSFLFSLCISRTCGGDPHGTTELNLLIEYFPHMRGWSSAYPDWKGPNSVFPAHAGVILSVKLLPYLTT